MSTHKRDDRCHHRNPLELGGRMNDSRRMKRRRKIKEKNVYRLLRRRTSSSGGMASSNDYRLSQTPRRKEKEMMDHFSKKKIRYEPTQTRKMALTVSTPTCFFSFVIINNHFSFFFLNARARARMYPTY